MNCKSVQNRLSAYLDRELGGDELLQIRAHVSMCRDCRAEADGLRALKSLLGGVQCPEPPEDLAERLTANMLRQRFEEPRRTVRASALMFAGVTACSMVVALAVMNFGVGRHGSSTANHLRGQETAMTAPDGPAGGDFGSAAVISAANFGPR